MFFLALSAKKKKSLLMLSGSAIHSQTITKEILKDLSGFPSEHEEQWSSKKAIYRLMHRV